MMEGEEYLFDQDPYCSQCVRGAKVLENIFETDYIKPPFIDQIGNSSQYYFNMESAKEFANSKAAEGQSAEDVISRYDKFCNHRRAEEQESIRKRQEARKIILDASKEKLAAKFGSDLYQIDGLMDELAQIDTEKARNSSVTLLDVKVDMQNNLGVYLEDYHSWGSSGGIGMYSVIGIVRDGKTESKMEQY